MLRVLWVFSPKLKWNINLIKKNNYCGSAVDGGIGRAQGVKIQRRNAVRTQTGPRRMRVPGRHRVLRRFSSRSSSRPRSPPHRRPSDIPRPMEIKFNFGKGSYCHALRGDLILRGTFQRGEALGLRLHEIEIRQAHYCSLEGWKDIGEVFVGVCWEQAVPQARIDLMLLNNIPFLVSMKQLLW